jgi:hypothetical protein
VITSRKSLLIWRKVPQTGGSACFLVSAALRFSATELPITQWRKKERRHSRGAPALFVVSQFLS